jgi:acyl dehydratase
MHGYLRTLARLALREARRDDRDEPDTCARIVARRRGLAVDDRETARYLAATAGTGIEALRSPEATLPPVYGGIWVTALTGEILLDPRAPSVRHGVVHLGDEAISVRPLRLGTEVDCHTTLERTVRERRGWRMELATRITDAAGRLCSEHRTVMLARTRPAGGRPAAAGEAAPSGSSADDGFEPIARWRVGPRDARRYARASGDWNPIHLSALTARPFGYRSPILHGFCLEAMAAHALIEARGGGDPCRLRRISTWFRRPLLLPAVVSLHADEGRNYRVVGDDGLLYAEGEFAVGAAVDA